MSALIRVSKTGHALLVNLAKKGKVEDPCYRKDYERLVKIGFATESEPFWLSGAGRRCWFYTITDAGQSFLVGPRYTPEPRSAESKAISAYLDACYAGLGAKWFTAHFSGECALTHATIKPGHQIGSLGNSMVVRKDATEVLSIRGNETIHDVLLRFAWASRELAAEWLASGDTVLLFTGSTLKCKLVRPERQLGSVTLDEVSVLHWRSVAFMLRRRDELGGRLKCECETCEASRE